MNSIHSSIVCATCLLVFANVTSVADSLLFSRLRCSLRFAALRYKPFDWDRFPVFYKDDSVADLLQFGTYYGADEIEEYVRAVDAPYFTSSVFTVLDGAYLGYNETSGNCVYLSYLEGKQVTNTSLTVKEETISHTAMGKIYFNFKDRYIKQLHIFLHPGYLDYFFKKSLRGEGEKTLDFICNVISTTCKEYISVPANCKAELSKLAPTDGELGMADGNTTGCRSLHSVFALINPKAHCPHIALEPTKDPNGKYKCFQSSNRSESDLWTKQELDLFGEFTKSLGYDPDIGYIVG